MALHAPGGAIQRALSCDSVASEASITDYDNADDDVANKIGQLEFSVQYLRYVVARPTADSMGFCISANRLIYYERATDTNKRKRRNTRKLCYRKDDRAMRLIYECPESS